MDKKSCTLPRIPAHAPGEKPPTPDARPDLAAIAKETIRDEKYRHPERELARRRNQSGE